MDAETIAQLSMLTVNSNEFYDYDHQKIIKLMKQMYVVNDTVITKNACDSKLYLQGGEQR